MEVEMAVGRHASKPKGKATELPCVAVPSMVAGDTARAVLDRFGIDALCALIGAGKLYREIGREIGVNGSDITLWVQADANRSARAKSARLAASAAWDEMALEVLSAIPDDGSAAQIARAREIASHYRWRAKALGRADYGDSVAVTGADGGPIAVAAVKMTDDELARIAAGGGQK